MSAPPWAKGVSARGGNSITATGAGTLSRA
jgi:hypothetical protein